MKRLEYIDVMKGIGILLVIISHHLLECDSVVRWIFSFHMPLFFIIRGYIIAYNGIENLNKKKIYSNANSLLYPYLTFSIISILWFIIYYIIILKQGTLNELGEIICKTALGYGYNALWFLPALFLAEVMYMYIGKNRVLQITVLILGLILLNHGFIKFIAEQGDFFYYIVCFIGRTIIAESFIFIGTIIFNLMNKIDGSLSQNIGILIGSLMISLSLFKCTNPDINLAVGKIGNPIIYYILYIGAFWLFCYICG